MLERQTEFTKEELIAIKDTRFFEVKKRVLTVTEGKLATLIPAFEEVLKSYETHTIGKLMKAEAKISKGENYLSLPYRVLDYPRYFTPELIFAYRSLFWWGHPYSFTLHISCSLLNYNTTELFKRLEILKGKGFKFCINSYAFHHHYGSDNYMDMDVVCLTKPELIYRQWKNGFLKLSRQLELGEEAQMELVGRETLELSLNALFL